MAAIQRSKIDRPPIRALLIDLSGTLHVGTNALPGAVDAIRRLVEARVPFRFISNASMESRQKVTSKLEKMGLLNESGDGDRNGGRRGSNVLWTSLGAVRDLVVERDYKRPYFLLSDSALEEFSDLDTVNEAYDPNKEYDSVILGLAPDRMTYANLNNAFQILNKHKDGSRRPAFITAHKSAYLRTSTGDLSLGPGAFVEALEYSLRPVGVTAEVVGKPQTAFYERVARSLDEGSGQSTTSAIRYADIAVIGDDISADLSEGAVELGFWRVLVKTGKYRPGDESRKGLRPPDEVSDSFASFVESFLRDWNRPSSVESN